MPEIAPLLHFASLHFIVQYKIYNIYLYIYITIIYIAEFMKTRIDENYSSFTKAEPNKGNYKPDEPENHRKERKEGKEARARGREKKTINSL